MPPPIGPWSSVTHVHQVVTLRPAHCAQCGQALAEQPHDPTPHRHQVYEVPPLSVQVTEYQRHTLPCPGCGARTPAVPRGQYGPLLTALAATLTGQYHDSKRAAAQLLRDLTGVPLSVATLVKLEHTMSTALAAPVAAVRAAVPSAPVCWVDETGWPQQREPDPATAAPAEPVPEPAPQPKSWLWVAVTPDAVAFWLRRSRGATVVTDVLGPTPAGVVHTDRWSAYAQLPLDQRQVCWAHLARDWVKWTERPGVAHDLGVALQAETRILFGLWHRYVRQSITREELQAAMRPVQEAVHAALTTGAATADARTATACRKLLALVPALWTFLGVDGVEPTNNAAERALRTAVLWRKGCFGTQTQAGSRFVERILTAVATCRRQERAVLPYLTAVAEAAYHGTPAPMLLPAG
jgi:transposase